MDLVYASKPQLQILSSADALVQSHSGTGKTCGIILSALNKIDETRNQPQAIIFCATFDTAYQTFAKIRSLIEMSGSKIKTCLQTKLCNHGFQNVDPAHAHILIGTPNELVEKLKSDAIKIGDVSQVFMDDADAYASWQKLKDFYGSLRRSARLVFTMRAINQSSIEQIQKWCSKKMQSVMLPKEKLFNKNIRNYAIKYTDPSAKLDLLRLICEEFKNKCVLGQMVIFCNVSVLMNIMLIILYRDFIVTFVLIYSIN